MKKLQIIAGCPHKHITRPNSHITIHELRDGDEKSYRIMCDPATDCCGPCDINSRAELTCPLTYCWYATPKKAIADWNGEIWERM
jgi:hypothetical protein